MARQPLPTHFIDMATVCSAKISCAVGPILRARSSRYPFVRMRRDVYDGRPLEGMHVISERSDRVFLGVDTDRKGSSAPVRIGGIAFLRESDDIRIEPASGPLALPDLWHLNFRVATQENRAKSFLQLSRLAGLVSSWNVYRPLRLDQLDATVDLIAQHFAR